MTDELKLLASKKAVTYLESDMILGVGTGSTVDIFIDELGKSGLNFKKIFTTSERSKRKLNLNGFNVLPISQFNEPISIYVDGADEIDHSLQMIKGGGGALTLEKIVSHLSSCFLCIVDETKLVKNLGKFPLPVEVLKDAVNVFSWIISKDFGASSKVRDNPSDHGNAIIDIYNLKITDPLRLEYEINSLPGVITNGIFAKRKADTALVGTKSGINVINNQN